MLPKYLVHGDRNISVTRQKKRRSHWQRDYRTRGAGIYFFYIHRYHVKLRFDQRFAANAKAYYVFFLSTLWGNRKRFFFFFFFNKKHFYLFKKKVKLQLKLKFRSLTEQGLKSVIIFSVSHLIMRSIKTGVFIVQLMLYKLEIMLQLCLPQTQKNCISLKMRC